MTRVLVVHHDLDMAGMEVDSLRRYGYDVAECGGPSRNSCPILAGRPCDLVDRADVLVYDVWASGESEGSRMLVENLRDLHPETPVVLTHPGIELSWETTEGSHDVTPMVGQPTGERLHEAITAAIAAHPTARVHVVASTPHGEEWSTDVLHRLAST